MIFNTQDTKQKAQNIKAILFDVDGVLTDGGIIYDDNGIEYKRYNVKDGQIISHLRKYAPYMAKLANTVGVNGFFFEVHENPEEALSDGPNMVYLKDFKNILESIR